MKGDVSLEELREKFRYEPETGRLYRKADLRIGFDASRPVGTPWGSGYLRVQIRTKDIAVHKIAWALYYGEFPEGRLDHIDRNRQNNRISNLRAVTATENNWNVGVRGRINAKGVGQIKGSRKYRANIIHFRKRIFLGSFETIDEAAHAYNKAAIQLQGEFAVLNPIGQDK
jgi:hypothetical protein